MAWGIIISAMTVFGMLVLAVAAAQDAPPPGILKSQDKQDTLEQKKAA